MWRSITLKARTTSVPRIVEDGVAEVQQRRRRNHRTRTSGSIPQRPRPRTCAEASDGKTPDDGEGEHRGLARRVQAVAQERVVQPDGANAA